jgi:hypothetical protein
MSGIERMNRKARSREQSLWWYGNRHIRGRGPIGVNNDHPRALVARAIPIRS